MKHNIIIQLKAAFLIAVFASNTVVGLACSLGVDMGFNSKHHDDSEATEAVVHVHKGGKQHLHHHNEANPHHEASHRPREGSHHHQPGSKKDNCCTDDVHALQETAKSVPGSLHVLSPVFFTTFVAAYYHISLLPYTNVITDIKPFVRSYHPPIPDIRIAIQSFQI